MTQNFLDMGVAPIKDIKVPVISGTGVKGVDAAPVGLYVAPSALRPHGKMAQDSTSTLMDIYGVNSGQQYGPGPQDAPINLQDPNAIDWGALAQQYQLSPEEVQQLQIAPPQGGPGLQERLQALRPQMNIGPLNLSTDGRRLQGSMKF